MKRREVVFAPEAREDLAAVYDWIAEAASAELALRYVERLKNGALDSTWLRSAAMHVKISGLA